MCCMCLLVGSPKISVHIGISGWLHLQSCWVHTQVTENCFVFIWLLGKTWIYLWDSISKLEFMQWKDVDCPTFTQICNSAINWLDYSNNFSGIQTDCLWHYLHPGKTTTGQYYAQEAQLSPRDHAMRRVNWYLANCHATVQKLLIRQVLTKSMVWSWRCSRRQLIDSVHSIMTRPSRLPLSQVS